MAKKSLITIHIVFWLIIILTMHIGFSERSTDTGKMIYYTIGMSMLLLGPVLFYLAYFNIFKMLQKWHTVVPVIIFLIVICFILLFINYDYFVYYYMFITRLLFWVALGGVFRFFIDWNNKQKATLELSQQNLKSELALLRMQINPHFLFNSLHNIDTLIMIEPEKSSKSLLTLSDILHFIFYESDKPTIKLSKEIEFIKEYIQLQQLRVKQQDLVLLEIIGSDTHSITVAPMLFIPFIENAFKHTTDKQYKHAIRILFEVNENVITFSISNPFDKNKPINKDKSSGIGITNVKRRLELLYKGRYTLDIDDSNYIYEVMLRLETDEID